MKKLLLIIMIWFLPMASAFAVKMSSLYQAELSVAAQSDDERDLATTKGFVQVLIKLTGDPEIDKNPVIKANLHRASYYVQEYSYSSPTPSSSQYFILIRYDADDMNNLLKKAGVSYWPENRPLILVWLAVTNAQHAIEIVGNEEPGNILSTMRQESKKFGLPLIFPIMDMADIDKVSPKDIRSMTLPILKEAGKRYSPDALLIGNLYQDNGVFQSQWQLVLNDNQWDFTVSDKTPEGIVVAALNQVRQTLVKHYWVR